MSIETNDLTRLAHDIRHFLGKGGWLHRITGMAKLYLEFPDVGAMYDFHRQLMQALDPALIVISGDTLRRIDHETIEIEVGGISVILTCKQRFALPDGNSVGYANMQFNIIKGPMSE
jgi:hypothetical protein